MPTPTTFDDCRCGPEEQCSITLSFRGRRPWESPGTAYKSTTFYQEIATALRPRNDTVTFGCSFCFTRPVIRLDRRGQCHPPYKFNSFHKNPPVPRNRGIQILSISSAARSHEFYSPELLQNLRQPVSGDSPPYSWGPAATRALPSSLPVYLAKFLMKRADRSLAFSSQIAGSV